MADPDTLAAVREALRERLCGFDDDGTQVVRVELLGSLDEIAQAALDAIVAPCGGCQGLGSHRRLCPRNPDYHPWKRLAVQAESIGDSIGEPGLANHAWTLATRITAGMADHPWSPRGGTDD